jgi:hypothetical protein
MILADRVRNIILTPKTEWPAIAAEKPNAGHIMTGYILPLALIPAIASLLGFGFFGRGLFGASLRWGIAMGLIQFVSAFVGVYVTAFIADFLAPSFGSQKSIGRALQLVAYSHTPGWVAGVFLLLPTLGILATLAMLYGLYLLYLGLPPLMRTPPDKTLTYLIVLIILAVVVYILIGAILTPVFMGALGLRTV